MYLFGERGRSLFCRRKSADTVRVFWELKCSVHICVRRHSMGLTVGLWWGREWNGEKGSHCYGVSRSQRKSVEKGRWWKIRVGLWESVLLKSQFLCMKYAASATPSLQSLCLTLKLRHRPFSLCPPSPPNLPSRLCTHLFSTMTLSDVFAPSKCSLFLIKTE